MRARTLVEIRDAILSAVSAFHDFFMSKLPGWAGGRVRLRVHKGVGLVHLQALSEADSSQFLGKVAFALLSGSTQPCLLRLTDSAGAHPDATECQHQWTPFSWLPPQSG